MQLTSRCDACRQIKFSWLIRNRRIWIEKLKTHAISQNKLCRTCAKAYKQLNKPNE